MSLVGPASAPRAGCLRLAVELKPTVQAPLDERPFESTARVRAWLATVQLLSVRCKLEVHGLQAVSASSSSQQLDLQAYSSHLLGSVSPDPAIRGLSRTDDLVGALPAPLRRLRLGS